MLNAPPEYPEEIINFKTYYNNLTPFHRFLHIPSQFGKKLDNNVSALKIFSLAANSLPSTERTEAWAELDFYELLNDVTFNNVAIHQNPMGIPHGFIALKNADLLDDPGINSNHDAILVNKKPAFAARVLVILNQANILTDTNRHAVVVHPHARLLHLVLTCLRQTGQFNIKPFSLARLWGPATPTTSTAEISQDNFDSIIECSEILFGTDEARALWRRLPAYALTEVRWESMLTSIWMNRHNIENAHRAFIRDMRNLLGMRSHSLANDTYVMSYEATPEPSPRRALGMFDNSVAPEPEPIQQNTTTLNA